MSTHPRIQQYADAELQARRLQNEAREAAAQTGVAAALKKVNAGLGEYLQAALNNRFDSIRVTMDGQVLYLKRQVKRTARPVTVEAIARAFDSLRSSDLRIEQEARPAADALDILVSCLIRAMEWNPGLYSCSDRVVLETAPLRQKRVVDESTTEIRVYDAQKPLVELAKRQIELKRAKAQLDALSKPKTKRAKALREGELVHLDEILTIVADEEARGVQVVHTDPATGARLRLMPQTKTVKAKPVTVPLLNKSGMLKRIVEAAIDTKVYGTSADGYLQREVRTELLAAFNTQHHDYVQTNTSEVTTMRVQTIPGARPVQTGRPPAAAPVVPKGRKVATKVEPVASPSESPPKATGRTSGPAKKPGVRARGGSTDKRDGGSGTPAPRKRTRKSP